MEVAQVWNHTPLSWHVHVDRVLVETTADLIKLASDKEEQLQASSADQIQRLVCVELQRAQAGRSHRPYAMQLADISEGEENAAVHSETPVLMAELRLSKLRIVLRVLETTLPFSYKSIAKGSS